MNVNMRNRNEVLAQTVIKGLESRNMSGYYAADKEAAVKQALELIPEGSSIAMGGCASAHEIGLIKVLEDGNYNYINREKLSPRESLLVAYDADVFLSSANAITSDGVMVNIDGNSNRRHQVGESADWIRNIVVAYIYKDINIVTSYRFGDDAFTLTGTKTRVLNFDGIGISLVSFKGERI